MRNRGRRAAPLVSEKVPVKSQMARLSLRCAAASDAGRQRRGGGDRGAGGARRAAGVGKVHVTNTDMHLAHVQRRVVLDDSEEEEATAEPAARATPLVSDSPVPETPVVPGPQQAIDLAGEQPSPVAIELSDEGGNGQKPEPTSRPRRLS